MKLQLKLSRSARQALALLQLIERHEIALAAHNDKERLHALHKGKSLMVVPRALVQQLTRQDLASCKDDVVRLTEAGRAFLARHLNPQRPFIAQQQTIERRRLPNDEGELQNAEVNISESPLAWLHYRRGKHGQPLINEAQFAAGERLRVDFTRAQLSPRVTSSWDPSLAGRQKNGASLAHFAEGTLAARKKVDAALDAVGPELSGILLDVCCFLKGLETVERERQWPARTAKIVLQLGLDRLAAHYGLETQAVGKEQRRIRYWGDDGYRPEFRL